MKNIWKRLAMTVGLVLALGGLSVMMAQTATKRQTPVTKQVVSKVSATPRPAAAPVAATFPHMDAALVNLEAALKELNAASPIFYGRRHAAVAHVQAAITAIKQGKAEVEKQGPQKAATKKK